MRYGIVLGICWGRVGAYPDHFPFSLPGIYGIRDDHPVGRDTIPGEEGAVDVVIVDKREVRRTGFITVLIF